MKKYAALFLTLVLFASIGLSGCDTVQGDGTTDGKPDVQTEIGENNGDDAVIVEDGKAEEQQEVEKKDPQKKKPGQNTNATEENGKKPDNPVVEPKPDPQPEPSDKMNWPVNDYTKMVPKPSNGVVRKADTQDGIYCLLLTGADMVDSKAYAASLISAGYTNEVTETIENGTYLFGGGNAKGSFVVVSYQNGQFIIGIQR